MTIHALIDRLIAREGGYVDHPADRGGAPIGGSPPRSPVPTAGRGRSATCRGACRRDLRTRLLAGAGLRPDRHAGARAGGELFDTGVNMGTATATGFLQRALNALNRGQADYPDLAADGAVGARTLAALDAFLRGAARRGRRAGQGDRCLAGRTLCHARRAPPRPTRPFCTAGSRGVSRDAAPPAAEDPWCAARAPPSST